MVVQLFKVMVSLRGAQATKQSLKDCFAKNARNDTSVGILPNVKSLFFMFCRLPQTGLKTTSLTARTFVLVIEDLSCGLANWFYVGYRFFWKYVRFIPLAKKFELQIDRVILILVQLWLGLRAQAEDWFLYMRDKSRRYFRKEKSAPETLAYRVSIERPPFESGFKTWIRVAAFIVVTVFLPEQVSWAIDFDWRVLWPNTASAMGLDKSVLTGSSKALAPEYVKDIYRINIPDTIKKLLLDISGKPINTIQLSPTMSVELKEPLKMSKGRIEQIYNWLKGKPCGIKALFDYLKMQGAQAEEQDVAVLALAVDILNDVVVPEGNPKVIMTSLFALAKASEFFNHKLIPVKLNNAINSTNSITPFIAHFNSEHYVLVTRLSQEKVYFIDQHQEEFLPAEKFLEDSSGYALVPAFSSQLSALSLLSDEEAKSILGARSYKSKYSSFSKLFKEPKRADLYISLAITAASAGFGAAANAGWMGSGAKTFLGSSNGFFKDFAAGLATSEISKSATLIGIRNLGMNQNTAQIFGYAVGGGISGGLTASAGGGWTSKWSPAKTFLTNHPVVGGVAFGMLKGGAIGGGSLLGYKAIQNTGFYKSNPYIAKQVGSFLGGAAGYMGFTAAASLAGFNQKMTTTSGTKKDGTTQTAYGREMTPDTNSQYAGQITGKAGGVAYAQSGTQVIFTPETFGQTMKLAWMDMSHDFIYQGTALATEYALSELTDIDMKYSRVLGEGMGSLASKSFSNQGWKEMMMGGAISGLSSFGLNALGGEYNKKSGKNKWGMTELQMAGVSWLATAGLFSGVGSVLAKTDKWQNFLGGDNTGLWSRVLEFQTSYLTWNGTSPFYTHGAGGWTEVRYLEKMAEWGGYANLAANADYAMKVSGYKSWSKFIKDGRAGDLFPSIENSLVRYTASTLHYSAAENLSATMGYLPKKATDFMGIRHYESFSGSLSDLLSQQKKYVEKLKEEFNKTTDPQHKTVLENQIKYADNRVSYLESEKNTKGNETHSWILAFNPGDNFGLGGNGVKGGSRVEVVKDGKSYNWLSLSAYMAKPSADVKVYEGDNRFTLEETAGGLTKEKAGAVGDKGMGNFLRIEGDSYLEAFRNMSQLRGIGHLNIGAKELLGNDKNSPYYSGAFTFDYRPDEPTKFDVYVQNMVTPKKSWFDKKENIEKGRTYVIADKPIKPKGSDKRAYLYKHNEETGEIGYAADVYGYERSGKDGVKITNSQGDKSFKMSDQPQVQLSLKGNKGDFVDVSFGIDPSSGGKINSTMLLTYSSPTLPENPAAPNPQSTNIPTQTSQVQSSLTKIIPLGDGNSLKMVDGKVVEVTAKAQNGVNIVEYRDASDKHQTLLKLSGFGGNKENFSAVYDKSNSKYNVALSNGRILSVDIVEDKFMGLNRSMKSGETILYDPKTKIGYKYTSDGKITVISPNGTQTPMNTKSVVIKDVEKNKWIKSFKENGNKDLYKFYKGIGKAVSYPKAWRRMMATIFGNIPGIGALFDLSNEQAAAYREVEGKLPYHLRPWFSSDLGLSALNKGADFGKTFWGWVTNDAMHSWANTPENRAKIIKLNSQMTQNAYDAREGKYKDYSYGKWKVAKIVENKEEYQKAGAVFIFAGDGEGEVIVDEEMVNNPDLSKDSLHYYRGNLQDVSQKLNYAGDFFKVILRMGEYPENCAKDGKALPQPFKVSYGSILGEGTAAMIAKIGSYEMYAGVKHTLEGAEEGNTITFGEFKDLDIKKHVTFEKQYEEMVRQFNNDMEKVTIDAIYKDPAYDFTVFSVRRNSGEIKVKAGDSIQIKPIAENDPGENELLTFQRRPIWKKIDNAILPGMYLMGGDEIVVKVTEVGKHDFTIPGEVVQGYSGSPISGEDGIKGLLISGKVLVGEKVQKPYF